MNADTPIVKTAHWHIPLDATDAELSLVFYGRAGTKPSLGNIDMMIAFLSFVRSQRASSMERKTNDYSI